MEESVQNQSENDVNNSELQQETTKKIKKPSKKMLILCIIVFVALIGGIAVWVLLKSDSERTEVAQNQQAEQASSIITLTKDTLFYKIGRKLVAYDPILNVQQVLSEELTDEDALILDFYSNYQNEWRAFIASYSNDKQKVFLLTQNGIEREVDLPDNTFFGPASAQHKLFTYDILPGFEEGEIKTTRTYVVSGNADPELIRESDTKPEDGERDGAVTSDLFVAVDISPNGKKVLFQQANCFQCDGGFNARVFELTLGTNGTAVVNQDETLGNEVRYNANGTLEIIDSNLGGVGEVSKVDITLLTDTTEGNFVPSARVQNDDWRLVTANKDYSFLAAERADDASDEFSATVFDGFYRLGATTGRYDKVNVTGLSGDVFVSEIGEYPPQSENNCFGVGLASRNEEINTADDSYEIGYICVSTEGVFNYTKVFNETLQLNDGINFVEPVRVLN